MLGASRKGLGNGDISTGIPKSAVCSQRVTYRNALTMTMTILYGRRTEAGAGAGAVLTKTKHHHIVDSQAGIAQA